MHALTYNNKLTGEEKTCYIVKIPLQWDEEVRNPNSSGDN